MWPVTISPTPPRASCSWIATSVSVTSPSGPPADSDVPERTMRFRVSTGPMRPGSRRIVEPSPFFTARERAALRFTDAVTNLADGHVSDEVYEEVSEHFDEAELAQLLFAAVAINAWNRLAIATRKLPVGPRS